MSRDRAAFVTASAGALAALPSVAYADIALPTLATFMGTGLVLLFIPIVLIEGFVLRRWLDLDSKRALKVAAVANAVSTLLGLPAAWLLDGAFRPGYGWVERSLDLHLAGWIPFPIIFAVFVLASWLVEYLVAGRMLPQMGRSRLNRAVLLGNCVSYLLLATVIALLL